jgi:serine/threonine-protein phosphatase Stp1
VLGAALKASTPKRAADLLIDFVMQGPARDNLSAVVVRQMPGAQP